MAIVPRWEWRVFGEGFGPAEDVFAALDPERVQEDDDVYVLSRHSDASVKLRDGLADVKRVVRVDEEGLEQAINSRCSVEYFSVEIDDM